MASAADIALVKLQFKGRDDFDLTDDEIGTVIDATGSVIDACIFIADIYVSRYAANSSRLTVGPITIDDTNASSDWAALKQNFILRKNQGAGVPGSGGRSPLIAMGGAVLSGVSPSQFWVGQFDNPPVTSDE